MRQNAYPYSLIIQIKTSSIFKGFFLCLVFHKLDNLTKKVGPFLISLIDIFVVFKTFYQSLVIFIYDHIMNMFSSSKNLQP